MLPTVRLLHMSETLSLHARRARRADGKYYYHLELDGHGSRPIIRRVGRAAYDLVKRNRSPSFRRQVIQNLIQNPDSVRAGAKKLRNRGVNNFSAGRLPVFDPLNEYESPSPLAPRGTLTRYLQQAVALDREHRRALKMKCTIPLRNVKILLRELGIRVPGNTSSASSASCQSRSGSSSLINDVCHRLAEALIVSTLPTSLSPREQAERLRMMRPVRILGSGIAGFAFQLADKSVIKVVSFKDVRLTNHMRPVTKQEFLHEVRMLKFAHKALAKTRTRVPQYLSHRIIKVNNGRRGRQPADIGVIHMKAASGVPIPEATFMPVTRRAKLLGLALANIHNAGLVHGDSHVGNFLVDKRGSLTAIDWGRAFTLSWFQKNDKMPLYYDLVHRDVAFTAYAIGRSRRNHKIIIDTYRAHCKNCIPDNVLARIEQNPERFFGNAVDRIFAAMDSMNRQERSS